MKKTSKNLAAFLLLSLGSTACLDLSSKTKEDPKQKNPAEDIFKLMIAPINEQYSILGISTDKIIDQAKICKLGADKKCTADSLEDLKVYTETFSIKNKPLYVYHSGAVAHKTTETLIYRIGVRVKENQQFYSRDIDFSQEKPKGTEKELPPIVMPPSGPQVVPPTVPPVAPKVGEGQINSKIAERLKTPVYKMNKTSAIGADKSKVFTLAETIDLNKEHLVIIVSASWCPPCKAVSNGIKNILSSPKCNIVKLMAEDRFNTSQWQRDFGTQGINLMGKHSSSDNVSFTSFSQSIGFEVETYPTIYAINLKTGEEKKLPPISDSVVQKCR